MKLIVNQKQRMATCRAHTATHLLHAELTKILPNTKQEGSFVGEDELRFDFSSDELLSQKELGIIQYNINSAISGGFPVEVFETTFDQAKTLGAKAFFQDKYGDIVRVVKIGWYDNDQNLIQDSYSVELCGGTHVTNTSSIGGFVITGQTAVATGVKRITALTGVKLVEYINEKQTLINQIAEKFETHEKQLEEKIEKILKHVEYADNTIRLLNTDIVRLLMKGTTMKDGYALIDTRFHPSLHTQQLSVLVQSAKEIAANCLIVSDAGAYAIISINGTAKLFGQNMGLKGGGQDTLFQGKDEKVYALFL